MVFPALAVLGICVLAIGVWPRATGVVTYGVLAWSLLIELAGGFSAPTTGCSTPRCSIT